MTRPLLMWQPSAADVETAHLTRFINWLNDTRKLQITDYDDLWHWSVGDVEQFWRAVWEFYEVGGPREPDVVLASRSMPGATWFPGSRVNMAEFLLRPRADDDAPAVITVGESGSDEQLTWRQLRAQVAGLASTLSKLGVGAGDVVAGYLPNIGQAVVSFLATASVGAIWSGLGQDYAPAAAANRLAQLEPVVLIAADGHVYNDRIRDNVAAVQELRAELPTVRAVIGVSRLGRDLPDAMPWAAAVAPDAPLTTADTAFSDPLWVLFTSGTTGVPKGIVHSHGGVALQQAQVLDLNWDLGRDDRFFWFTSPSWVMWNMLVGALGTGATIVCYDGAPAVSGQRSLWQVVARNRVTVFGTSPGYLNASEDAGIALTSWDMSALRLIGSSGAPLAIRSYDWVAAQLGHVPLYSLSGGTDVPGGFAMCAPTVAVTAGQMSVRGLGVALESWDEAGNSLTGELGEMVITEPLPAMPIAFWNDPGGHRYRSTYFEQYPGYWRHGDWSTVSETGTVVVHGRSDSTLNRGGVRMGTADIYAAVEQIPGVSETLIIGVEDGEDSYWMPMFVVLEHGFSLDQQLVDRIREQVRTKVSPRHVPDEIIAVRAIPHTKTGKKLEVPIKRLMMGAPVATVADPDAIDDPEALMDFVEFAENRR